jgi:hypothetical protein
MFTLVMICYMLNPNGIAKKSLHGVQQGTNGRHATARSDRFSSMVQRPCQ